MESTSGAALGEEIKSCLVFLKNIIWKIVANKEYAKRKTVITTDAVSLKS